MNNSARLYAIDRLASKLDLDSKNLLNDILSDILDELLDGAKEEAIAMLEDLYHSL